MEPLAETNRLLLRVSEAARMCGVSRSYLYQQIAKRAVPVIYVGDGRAVRIPRAWLDRWVDQKVKAWEEAHGQGESLAGPFSGGRHR